MHRKHTCCSRACFFLKNEKAKGFKQHQHCEDEDERDGKQHDEQEHMQGRSGGGWFVQDDDGGGDQL